MSIPKKAKKLNHRVLREGEHTGHAHRVTTDSAVIYDGGDGVLFARMPVPSRVVHEEHHKLFLPEGDKAVGAVREFDHIAEEARAVLD